MKKLIFLFALIGFKTQAQDVVTPDTIRQLSIGFNTLKLTGGQSTSIQQVGFIRNRVRNHAFKFTFNSSSYYTGGNTNQLSLPQKISINDSIISITSEYISQTTTAVSLSYEKFQLSSPDKSVELFSGIGIIGGTTHHDHGSSTLVYQKDTIGNFNFSDSLSYSTLPYLWSNTYKEYSLGLIPYAGVLIMPDRVLSIDMQISFPLTYDWRIPSTSAVKKSFSFSTEMLYSINVILNFNFNDNNESDTED